MDKKKWTFGIYLTVLALVFSIGLTFASVELPRLLHSALERSTPALDGDSHADEMTEFRTGLFMDHYHLRTIGYVCFALMVVLIVAGFVSGKTGLSSLGAGLLFLPVFAQFATVMFFLAGLGFLNLAWLPVLDISFDIGRLGDIVYWPYNVLISLFRGWGIDGHRPLVLFVLGSGLLLFVLGTLTWFLARQRGKTVADLWVYRLSRHPQYLGWIIWSYGMLLALKRVNYPKRSWGIPASLPWLLSMMVIVGVALLEERKMSRQSGEAYEEYRGRTSFLLPLPRFLRRIFSAPIRLLFGKSVPERKGEIAAVLIFTTAVLMISSHFYVQHRRYAQLDVTAGLFEADAGLVDKLVAELRRTESNRRRSWLADALADIGRPAAEPLIGLLDDGDPGIRQEAARALGRVDAQEAVGPLLRRLSDENSSVQFWAVSSLGQMRAEEALGPLVSILQARAKSTSRAAAAALGRIGSAAAVDALIGFLDAPSWWDRVAAVDALGEIGSEASLEALMARFDGEEVHVRRSIVVALLKIGSERAIGTLEAALGDADREVRLYASEALKRLRARAGTSGPESCTIVMAARDGLVLAGNNEDRNHPATIVNFIPASGSFFGRVVFGYDDAFAQGGMNDQGLFIDGNALRPTGWQPDPGKPTFRGNVMMSILATCATCEDVRAFFERSNVPGLGQARLPVADRTGASMVVEYGQGRVQFVRSDTWYQIATNFVMSNVEDGEYPCWRYKAADKIMSGAKELSVELIRDVLEKTHQEGDSLTVYSNIYDLKRGIVHVYNLRDFKKAVVLDLAEELKKGQRRLDLPSLFEPLGGSGPTGRTGTNEEGYQDILGCWEGAPDGRFADRNRQLRLIERKPDGRTAITLIYDLTPRCQVWEHDLDVTVDDGAVSWEAHRGCLSEDGNSMTVVKEWKGERSTWTFGRRKGRDDWMRRFAASTGKGYAYEVPESLDDGWECADLADVGIDRAAMIRFAEGIARGKHDDIHSLLIAKDGKLVLEEYFSTNGKRHGPFIEQAFRERPHHLASVTKGVLSTLCGMAVDRGLIKGVDEPIYKYLPAYAASFNDGKKAITVKDMLTMTPGWEWEQSQYPWDDPRNNAGEMYNREDVIKYVLERPLAAKPGAKFNYSNGVPTVMGAVLKHACGMDVDRYAGQALFHPLGISDYPWTRYFDGSLETDGGLALRSRDLAKIGQLFLNNGDWRGKNVISGKWVRESTERRIDLDGTWGWGYGYYWMQVDLKTRGGTVHSYFVPGDGGQLLAVFPDLDMVIVLTAGNYGRDVKSVCFSMIGRYVLPAVMPSVQ
mgnify:CR=1 FL=1